MSFFSRLFRSVAATAAAAAPAPAQAAPSEARLLRIVRVDRETADATTLTLAAVDGGPIVHQPGQFLMLRFGVASGPVWRAYSICTPPGRSEVAVTVKRIAGGLVSSHVLERAAEGDELLARGPMGRFVVPARAVNLFFLAGGSGITPIMSQLRALLAAGDARITLLYGNRSEDDIIFRAQLEALTVDHPRLRVRHVLSHPKGPNAAATGVLDEATVAQQLRALAPRPADFDAYLMCGPEPMMAAARRALLAHGVAEHAILEERFNAASLPSDDASGPSELRFVHEGKSQVVTVNAGETLLEATQRLNLPLDFSCMAGQCGTCAIKLEAGDLHVEEPNCLSAAERKRGLVLACVSRPRGPCTVSTVRPG